MKLSIITVNYNNKIGLQKTIDSVIYQTWKDFEWIIIDGGSTDGSRELIEKSQKVLDYWCSEPDSGVYNAMNKGIAKAKGEYLLFLNSGDTFYDNSILQKVNELHLDADIISGQVVRMDNNQLLRVYNRNILRQLFHNTLNHQGTFIKRSLFKDLKYNENYKVTSDWIFWLDSIIWRNANVETVDLIIAKQDMTGISSVNALLDRKERKEVLDKYFPPLIQKDLNSLWKLQDSIYVQRGEYLRKTCPTVYNSVIRVIGLLIRIIKIFK